MVQAALSSNTRGGSHGAGATPAAGQGIRPELVDAYSLAVALAPTGCHLSLSLLAAIGEVESGNLAGRRGDAQRRVVPGVLRPVLDGWPYAEIPDTDDGKLDGHKTWDRALGPLQLLPASWRVAGMDADGDGLRDPQNVYDAAGAAMVYLCGHGRDLGTRDGLEATVRAYNHSRDYLRLVLAWKTVFDTADVIGLGSMPTLEAWAAPTPLAHATPRASAGSSTGPAQQSALPAGGPSGSSDPGTTTARDRPPTATPTEGPDPAVDPTASPTAGPTASNPPAAPAKPGQKPGGKPGEPADKPSGNPDEDPTCQPPDEPTPSDDPRASPACCATTEPTQPTETPTPTLGDPSANPSEEPDPCATRGAGAVSGADSLRVTALEQAPEAKYTVRGIQV